MRARDKLACKRASSSSTRGSERRVSPRLWRTDLAHRAYSRRTVCAAQQWYGVSSPSNCAAVAVNAAQRKRLDVKQALRAVASEIGRLRNALYFLERSEA
jgi:hypothetical protein